MWNISIFYCNWFLWSSLIVLDISIHRKSSIRAHIDLCRLANGPWLFVFVAVTSIKTPKHQMEKLILGFRAIRCPVAAAMHSIESKAHFTISHNRTPDEKEGTKSAGFTFFALIRARRAFSLLVFVSMFIYLFAAINWKFSLITLTRFAFDCFYPCVTTKIESRAVIFAWSSK